MKFQINIRSGFCLLLCLFFAAAAESKDVAPVTAELVSEHLSVQPGRTFTVALRLIHEEHWHTYWQNPGTGYPTSIQWELPEGFTAGTIRWPVPKLLDSLGIVTYGYEGELFLPIEITPPAILAAGSTVRLAGRAKWLMCEEVCIPGSAQLEVRLPVLDFQPLVDPRWKQGLAETRARTQRTLEQWNVRAFRDGEDFALLITPNDTGGQIPDAPYFFSADGQVDPVARHPVERLAGGILMRLPKAPFESHLDDDSEVLDGALYAASGWLPDGSWPALEVSARLDDGPLPASGAAITAKRPGGNRHSFLAILALALVGGLILNLMPCVFPVLGLKIVGFVDRAGEDRRRVALHGLIFTVGVLLSFWILAGILAALRAGGEELGWGFQLQSPAFVFFLAVIITGFALNLAGVFEFGLAVTAAGSTLTRKSGYFGSFFSGVLATVVATPCAAPFLAPALGAALTLTTAGSFLIFTFIGLGLAAPYLALSLFPGCVRILPKPGPWMATFKQIMAFPLFATSAFLLWVLAGQVGEDQFLNILLALVLVGFALWIYGRWSTPVNNPMARILARISVIVLLAGAMFLGLSGDSSDQLIWEPWSPERVVALHTEGRPVYVDFTARWCATCKANKTIVFSSREVLDTFQSLDMATLKADWTNEDSRITEALATFNRSAVPLNIIYVPGREAPIILPELLTPGIVLDAIREMERP